MPKFTRIAALLLVAVAVVLAILAFSIGRRASTPVVADASATHALGFGQEPAMVPVVVAATTLPAGTPLASSSLKLVNWTQRPADGYGDVDAVVGGVPLIDISAGMAVTSRVLARGLSMALKPGERAVAVPVDEQAGAGNRIVPGDYVDVFVSLKAPPTMTYQPSAHGTSIDTSQTRLLLSRLRVLAYGSDDLPSSAAGAASSSAADDGKPKSAGEGGARQVSATTQPPSSPKDVPHTAVLAVPVGEASQLLLGVQNGKLSLGVRRPTDEGQPDDALFPQPRPVLTARADLTAEQRQQLQQPENQAYAGIDGSGLAGHDPLAKSPVRRSSSNLSPGIQIIRGASDDSARPARTNP
ncbi:Flp pilus assembly protein CpaB [Rhodanobacter sp. BL-MT-08]